MYILFTKPNNCREASIRPCSIILERIDDEKKENISDTSEGPNDRDSDNSQRAESTTNQTSSLALEHKHNIGTDHRCSDCDERFSTKRSLRQHINRSHTRRSRFKCPFVSCTKEYMAKSCLDRHINVARTNRHCYKCSRCPYITYYCEQLLLRHMRTHQQHNSAD